MEDLYVRLIDKNTVLKIDPYDINNLHIEKNGDEWVLEVTINKDVALVERFATENEAKLALHNITKAIAYEQKYITLLPGGSIEVAS